MAIKNYYRFNGNANDALGAANGTAENTNYTPGVMGSAAEFPNTNNGRVKFAIGTNNFTSEDFTFSFLYYLFSFTTSNPPNTPVPFFKGAWNTNGYYSYITSTYFGFYTNQSGTQQASLASFSFSLNTWYYITITRNGSSVNIFINGVDKTSTSGSHNNPTSAPTDFFLIGSYGEDIRGNVKYDEFMVEQRKWIASEVKNKYSYYKGFF